MAEEARQEGFDEIARLFEGVGAIEKTHEERYRKLLANVREGLVFSRDGDRIWECSNCGHIVIGPSAPEVCPVCASSEGLFQAESRKLLDTVDKSVVLWYNEEKRIGVFLHGEQLSTARYVRCDVGNSQAVHNRKQGNVGRQRKGYPSISEWRVLDFENGSTMERPAAGIW